MKNHEITIEEALLYGKSFLRNKEIDSYSLDARILLQHVTAMSHVAIITESKSVISAEKLEKYKELLKHRGNNKPIAYITNTREFMGLDFYVDERTLIPRPDTEILVNEALNYISKNDYKSLIEIGTGSGCICISISYYSKKQLNITACDISSDALAVAIKNSKLHGCESIAFLNSDIFSSVSKELKADIIISNPPYIETDTINTLSLDVKDYEPTLALDGGTDGLYFYKEIIKKGKLHLSSNGMFLFEIGYNQGKAVAELLNAEGFKNINIIKDLAGNDRVVGGCI